MNKASDAIVWVLSFCIALVAVYTAAFGIIDEIYQRSITVAVSLIVAIFGSSLAKLHEAESQNIKIGQWIIDFVLIFWLSCRLSGSLPSMMNLKAGFIVFCRTTFLLAAEDYLSLSR